MAKTMRGEQVERETRYPSTHTTPGGIILTHQGHGVYRSKGWTLLNNPAMKEDVYMVKGETVGMKLFPIAQALQWIDANN